MSRRRSQNTLLPHQMAKSPLHLAQCDEGRRKDFWGKPATPWLFHPPIAISFAGPACGHKSAFGVKHTGALMAKPSASFLLLCSCTCTPQPSLNKSIQLPHKAAQLFRILKCFYGIRKSKCCLAEDFLWVLWFI